MSSQYEEIKDATIPLFFGGFHEDRYCTPSLKEAWSNWYTVVRVYDDGYVECVYSEEYDIDCKCHAYNPDSSWYDGQHGCYVERVCHSHEDRYGPCDEIWEHLRKENPYCSNYHFYRNREYTNMCRPCKQSCFADSRVSSSMNYATYENDAYADAGYNTNALEDSYLVEDATTQVVREDEYHSEHEERVKKRNEESEKWSQQIKELVAEIIQPVLRKLEALKEIYKVPVVEEDEVSHVEDVNQTSPQPTHSEEMLRQFQMENRIEAEEIEKRYKLEAEERSKRYKLEDEERSKRYKLEADERVRKYEMKREEIFKRYRLKDDERNRQCEMKLEEHDRRYQLKYKDILAESRQAAKLITKAPKEIKKISAMQEAINIVDPTSKINKIPGEGIEVTMKVSYSSAEKENMSSSNEYQLLSPRKEGIQFNIWGGRIGTNHCDDSLPTTVVCYEGHTGAKDHAIKFCKGCPNQNSGGNDEERVHQELVLEIPSGDRDPLKSIGDDEVEQPVQAEEEDISYEFNSGSSLDDDGFFSSFDLAEIHDAVAQVPEEEKSVSYDCDFMSSLQSEDLSNSSDSGGIPEAVVETGGEKDGVSGMEDANLTSIRLTDFEEFRASKEALGCRIEALFARMDKSNEEHAIRRQRRRQMEAHINNLPEKRLDMAPTPSGLVEDVTTEILEEAQENCHDSIMKKEEEKWSYDVSCQEDTLDENAETLEADDIFYDCNSDIESDEDMLFAFGLGGSLEKEIAQQCTSEAPSVTSLAMPPSIIQAWPESTNSVEFVNVNEEFHSRSMIWLIIISLVHLFYYPDDSGFSSFTYLIILHANAHLIFAMWEEGHKYTITDMETHEIYKEMLLNVLLYEEIT
ncbi:hypothetical protein M5689_010325 [Euphorbia peplus]|nr:hypothetical protein M5689_010325 [Euphorbia peplus]